MRSLSAATDFGMPWAASISPACSGIPLIEPISMVVPVGVRSAAARSRAVLYDSLRRLPEMPMIGGHGLS